MKTYHGTILTVDSNDTIASYLVEDGGRIVFVGTDLPDCYRQGEIIELGAGALCPTFADTHIHLASYATFSAGLNVMNATSNKEIVAMVRQFGASSTAKLLIAFGASPYSVAEGRLVSREELDAACPDRPLALIKYDGHACVINSTLLERLRKKLAPLRGYHPDTGEMNQEAFFAVSDYISGSLSIPELVRNIQQAIDRLARRGIGMVHSVSGVGFPANLDISLETWLARSAQHGFQLRIFPQSLDTREAQKRRLPRIGGCFKCVLDGCFGSADAAMRQPYRNSQESGVLYYDDATVIDFCKRANRAGLQIEMHAIGDAAFDQATRALRTALEDCPRKDHRHGIIHACLPTERGLSICQDYGIQLPMQPAFIDWRQEPDSYLGELLGDERAAKLNPLRSLWDRGIVLSAGSDGPCTDPDPLLWMHRACNHSNPQEALTVQEALRMCTFNGYWTTFDDKERGSLEVGKVADMVVLSANPYATDITRLKALHVEETILGGRPYTDQSQKPLAAIMRGLAAH